MALNLLQAILTKSLGYLIANAMVFSVIVYNFYQLEGLITNLQLRIVLLIAMHQLITLNLTEGVESIKHFVWCSSVVSAALFLISHNIHVCSANVLVWKKMHVWARYGI